MQTVQCTQYYQQTLSAIKHSQSCIFVHQLFNDRGIPARITHQNFVPMYSLGSNIRERS